MFSVVFWLVGAPGIRPDVAELALGHSIKGIQGVYDDVKEYRPMIEHALQCVANEVAKIIDAPSGTVVALKRHK